MLSSVHVPVPVCCLFVLQTQVSNVTAPAEPVEVPQVVTVT